MPKLEVFYDYTCPYCLSGHENLLEIIDRYPGLECEWYPCEAHPRPETHRPHSDLCARAMYVLKEKGGDLAEYHRRMYNAALNDRKDIEDIGVICDICGGILGCEDLRKELEAGKYQNLLDENNRLAWEEYDFPAVPSYRMDGELLKSLPGVGVTPERLARFLEKCRG